MSSRLPRSRVVSRSSSRSAALAVAGEVEDAVPKVRAAATGAASEDEVALLPGAVLSRFAVETMLSTVSNALGWLVQVQSVQVQMLRDLGNVLHTAHQDVQQAESLQQLWMVGLPGGRAASQLGGTLDSWRQNWRTQMLEAKPNGGESPALQGPFMLMNTMLQTSSQMLENWVNTARKTTHAIVVMG